MARTWTCCSRGSQSWTSAWPWTRRYANPDRCAPWPAWPAVLDLVGRFGRNTGVTAQLLNDLDGVSISALADKTDFRQRKKTLPVAYLLQCAKEDGLDDILGWYAGAEQLDPTRHVQLAT